jgi:two-component system response regulator AtoC
MRWSEKVDVRVVAATKRELAQEVARGAFREDLYYRLNVVNLRLPPLRERKQDIPALVQRFLDKFNAKLGRRPPVRRVTPAVLQRMQDYSWPGNVRELENAIERAMVLCEGEDLTEEGLPELLALAGVALPTGAPTSDAGLSIKRTVRALEEDLIRRALQKTRGNRTRAAELLEISHRALLYKIKDYAIDPDAEGRKGSG